MIVNLGDTGCLEVLMRSPLLNLEENGLPVLLANIVSGILVYWINEKGHGEHQRKEELIRRPGLAKAPVTLKHRELWKWEEWHLLEAHSQKILMLGHQTAQWVIRWYPPPCEDPLSCSQHPPVSWRLSFRAQALRDFPFSCWHSRLYHHCSGRV